MSAESDLIKKAKARAGRYCAYGERSPKQVRERLLSYGLKTDDADRVIQELILDNFVSEERFARAYANDKFRFNKWGRIKIRLELSRKHHLSTDAIETGLTYIDQTEYHNMIADLLKKKWDSLPAHLSGLQRKKRVSTFLINKGFESDLVFPQVEKLMSSKKH